VVGAIVNAIRWIALGIALAAGSCAAAGAPHADQPVSPPAAIQKVIIADDWPDDAELCFVVGRSPFPRCLGTLGEWRKLAETGRRAD
jgi:hypothetical protein